MSAPEMQAILHFLKQPEWDAGFDLDSWMGTSRKQAIELCERALERERLTLGLQEVYQPEESLPAFEL